MLGGNMKTKLTGLTITKVALVDEGSCSDAHIEFFKRKKGGTAMTFEEIMKSLPEDQQKLIQSEVEKAKKALPEGAMSAEDSKKMKESKEKEVAKLKKEVEEFKKQKPAESSPEDILKNAEVPAEIKELVQKSLNQAKAAEVAVAKLQEQSFNNELVAKTANLSNIQELDTEVLPFLKSIRGVDGAVDKALEIITKANTLIAKGEVFKEVGANGTQGSSSSDAKWDAIEKKAKELVLKGDCTKESAITKVMELYPDMYNDYIKAMEEE
jgi:hypothetical protein